MKKICIYGSVFILNLLLLPVKVFGNELCADQTGFNLYTCRVENICENYTSPKPVYNSKPYIEAENAAGDLQTGSAAPELEAVQALYRENMGNIYKCAIIQAQKNSLSQIEKFIKIESSGELSDATEAQIQLRINRLELSANRLDCTLADGNSVQNKLNILKETTFEACKYISYLEYLKAYYEQTGNLYSEEQQEINGQTNTFTRNLTPEQISNDINTRKNAIAVEIAHTYKVFPIAYQAYSEYENNFPIHFLLEMIRGDFLVLRQKLYENLMPIAQLGLKIINAMSF